MSSSSGKRLTKAQYDLLVRAFIEKSAAFSYAGSQAGTTPVTAKAMWEKGAPRKGWPPIKITVREYQQAARAQMERDLQERAKEEAKEAAQARAHAVRSRVQEGQMTDLAREQLVPLLATVARLAQQTASFAVGPKDAAGNATPGIALRILELEQQKLEKWLIYGQVCLAGNPNAIPAPSFDRPAMTMDQISRHMLFTARTAERLILASRQAFELHRLYLGQPTDIISVTDDIGDLSPEEFAAHVASVRAALASVPEPAGEPEPDEDEGLRVIPGGRR